jgi:hypothetical protein
MDAGLALRRSSGSVATPLPNRNPMHPPRRGSRGSGCQDFPAVRRADDLLARDQDWQRWYRALSPAPGEPPPIDETIGDLAERELTVLRAPELTFKRIQLDSRLEITLAAAGRTGVIIYALHLLCAFLQNQDRIDGWLPRLVAGWHKARRDAEMVRQEHRDEVGQGQLTDLLIKQNI